MAKSIRYVVITLIALLLLLMVAPYLIPAEKLRLKLEQQLSQTTGQAVTIGKLSFTLFPTPALQLETVATTITQLHGFTARASITSAKTSLAPLPLLSKELVLQGISLEGLHIDATSQINHSDVRTLHIDQLQGSLKLTDKHVKLNHWKASLYGGEINLDAVISSLRSAKQNLKGEININGLQLLALTQDISGRSNFSGTLSHHAAFSTFGLSSAMMQKNLKIDGPVKVTQGKVEGLVMQGNRVKLMADGNNGFVVDFDSLNFNLKTRGQNHWLTQLGLKALLFGVAGDIQIKGNRMLEGSIQTAGLATLAGDRFSLSGTIQQPLLYPLAQQQ